MDRAASIPEAGEAPLVDVVQRWSVRIAQRVAPKEVDFAAEVGAAYAAGGQARKDLLPRPGVQPGAFGPGAVAADLPMILRGLADAANMLVAFLGSSYFSNAVAAGSLLLAFRAEHHHERAPQSQSEPQSESQPAPPAPPESEKQALESAFESLRGRLTAAGFEEARAGQLAYELLGELLTDTAEAAQFVDALAAVPDGAPPRDSAAKHPGRRRKGR